MRATFNERSRLFGLLLLQRVLNGRFDYSALLLTIFLHYLNMLNSPPTSYHIVSLW